MRIRRVIVEDGETARTLALHPALTVIAGIGAAARTALLDEVVHALAGDRAGVHVELVDRHGTHLALLHPRQAPARLVDVGDGTDLSEAVRGPLGRIDLLSSLGFDPASATATMRLGPEDLVDATRIDAAIGRLACLDQIELWELAGGVCRSRGQESDPDRVPDPGPGPDNGIADDPRHLFASQPTGRRGRRRRGRGENLPPPAAPPDPAERWHELAGDVEVDWALAHREEIEAGASLRRRLAALELISSTVPDAGDDEAGELAGALVEALVRTRHAGAEGLPLVLDDPFGAVDGSLKPLLLELVGQASRDQQVILLTSDDEVASWARLEALTGELGVVEPSGDGATSLHR